MGAGAIGSLFGGYLAKAGHDVSFVGRKAHMDKINEKGLIIRGINQEERIQVKCTTNPSDLNAPDIIILTVKAYDTQKALQDALKLLSPSTYLLCLQNGLGTEEIAAKIINKNNIIRGTTSEGALFLEPGEIQHTGRGNTIIGYPYRNADDFLESLQQELIKAGFSTTISDSIEKVVWEKIFVNVAINPFGALTGLRNGELLMIPELKESMKTAILEGLQVAEKLGLDFNEEIPIQKAYKVAEMTARNKNSMLQDIEKGKKTEIDFINGAIVKYGKKVGIKCPINMTLVALVKGLEKRNELHN